MVESRTSGQLKQVTERHSIAQRTYYRYTQQHNSVSYACIVSSLYSKTYSIGSVYLDLLHTK